MRRGHGGAVAARDSRRPGRGPADAYNNYKTKRQGASSQDSARVLRRDKKNQESVEHDMLDDDADSRHINLRSFPASLQVKLMVLALCCISSLILFFLQNLSRESV